MTLGQSVHFNEVNFRRASSKDFEKADSLHTASIMKKRLSSSAGTTDLPHAFLKLMKKQEKEN